MKHIDYTRHETKTQRTTTNWLPVGANIARVANKWASRDDLVAFIGEGATEGRAPALFRPDIAEIEIDIEKAFGFGVKPESIGDLEKISTRYEFPRATGAILHEAFHARFSRWDIVQASKELEADELQALILLEESRIEKLGIELDKNYRPFLRAVAFDLVIGDLDLRTLETMSVQASAQLSGLIHARVIAGILDADEVTEILQVLRKVLGEDAFIELAEIADKFQQHKNHFVMTNAYPLAKRWAEIVRDLQKERGEEPQEQEAESSPSSDSSPSEGGLSDELKEILEALKECSEKVEMATSQELYDQETQERWEEEVKERQEASKEREKAVESAKDVFEPEESEDSSASTTETSGRGTYSRLVEVRNPESSERRAAVLIARLLEKAKYRERDVTEVTSRIPQGKLRTRAAVQNAAQKAQGLLPTSDEWERRVRKHTDEPTLSVGVMVDISGSMRAAMNPMATTAWVMSEAVRRVQGKTAMVYYGQDVFPTLKAGQHLDQVKVWTAQDPTEKFDKAFTALDGALNLLNGRGARLLVVVSDGVYTDGETTKATKWIKRCEQEGVAVLWLTFSNDSHYARAIADGTKTVVLSGTLNPADAAVEIGRAAAQALELTNAA
jgi:hypothetical protein